MVSREPFLAALRAEPENWSMRLVYADWLEEQGDPEAGFQRWLAATNTVGPDPDLYVGELNSHLAALADVAPGGFDYRKLRAPNDDHMSKLISKFAAIDVWKITATYSGCGDDGQIDSIVYEPSISTIEYADKIVTELAGELERRLWEYAPAGFENNAGGSGTIVIWTQPGLISITHSNRDEDHVSMDIEDERLPIRMYHAIRKRVPKAARVIIEYSGYGDSGQVDDVAIFTDANTRHEAFPDLLDYADQLTSDLDYDWYNNDGGGGTITIDLKERMVSYDAYFRDEIDLEEEVTLYRLPPVKEQ